MNCASAADGSTINICTVATPFKWRPGGIRNVTVYFFPVPLAVFVLVKDPGKSCKHDIER